MLLKQRKGISIYTVLFPKLIPDVSEELSEGDWNLKIVFQISFS